MEPTSRLGRCPPSRRLSLRPESWVLPAMVAASVLLGAVFSDSNWGVRKLSADQVRELAARQCHSLGTFYDEYVDGFLGRNQL
jgi:hypothetical protein